MFRRLIVILSILGMAAGGLALGAGAASAGTVPQPLGQHRVINPRPEPVQFNFCTRADRAELFRLLFLQRIGVHLNRSQRFELRILERFCGFEFQFPVQRDQFPFQRA